MHFRNLDKILPISKNKDQLHSFYISQVIGSEKCGYLNARKLLIWKNFESQRFHGSQTLLKSTWQHFYPKFPLIENKLS